MRIIDWDTVIIGAGPAGLAAAVSAGEKGARACILEREERPGGILKQCIHDGFGLVRFQEKITGPEYAYRYIEMVKARRIPIFTETYLTRVLDENNGFLLTTVSPGRGVEKHRTKSIVLSTGCRERTDRQVFIHGDRPAGIYTAGLAQYFVNIQGLLPGKRTVILGSGDIGLIMARRLTLEGVEVEGVYEIKGEPSGLTRNIVQCLEDFGIPLHLSTTIVRVLGSRRLSGVVAASVDEEFRPIPGTEREIPCDTLILSVGLIPENEIAETLSLSADPATRGPKVDQWNMTEKPGVFVCGNALQVNDLVDYVSENGHTAGAKAAVWAESPWSGAEELVLTKGKNIQALVPQRIVLKDLAPVPIFFRSAKTLEGVVFLLKAGDRIIKRKRFVSVRPPEMERVEVDFSSLGRGDFSGGIPEISAHLERDV